MAPELNATGGLQPQPSQNLQSAGAVANSAGAGSVQSGTAQNLLASSNGIPLTVGTVSKVGWSSGSVAAAPVKNTHHINTTLLGLAGIFIVAAVAMALLINRSVKSTT